jgi:hypothetical protein
MLREGLGNWERITVAAQRELKRLKVGSPSAWPSNGLLIYELPHRANNHI